MANEKFTIKDALNFGWDSFKNHTRVFYRLDGGPGFVHAHSHLHRQQTLWNAGGGTSGGYPDHSVVLSGSGHLHHNASL